MLFFFFCVFYTVVETVERAPGWHQSLQQDPAHQKVVDEAPFRHSCWSLLRLGAESSAVTASLSSENFIHHPQYLVNGLTNMYLFNTYFEDNILFYWDLTIVALVQCLHQNLQRHCQLQKCRPRTPLWTQTSLRVWVCFALLSTLRERASPGMNWGLISIGWENDS